MKTLRLSTAAMLALLAVGQPATARQTPMSIPVVRRVFRDLERKRQPLPHQGQKEMERRRKRIEAGKKP